jgi:hypothetical protein
MFFTTEKHKVKSTSSLPSLAPPPHEKSYLLCPKEGSRAVDPLKNNIEE